MYLIFYDLDSLAQNAVDIQRFGNTVAVLLYAAALPLFIREDRREQLAECGYGDKQYDRQKQKRFDPGISELRAIFLLRRLRLALRLGGSSLSISTASESSST